MEKEIKFFLEPPKSLDNGLPLPRLPSPGSPRPPHTLCRCRPLLPLLCCWDTTSRSLTGRKYTLSSYVSKTHFVLSSDLTQVQNPRSKPVPLRSWRRCCAALFPVLQRKFMETLHLLRFLKSWNSPPRVEACGLLPSFFHSPRPLGAFKSEVTVFLQLRETFVSLFLYLFCSNASILFFWNFPCPAQSLAHSRCAVSDDWICSLGPGFKLDPCFQLAAWTRAVLLFEQ